MSDAFERLPEVTWNMPSAAGFTVLRSVVESRFGPPRACGVDTNGLGLVDCHALRFPCGLEVALWRWHQRWKDGAPERFDADVEPSTYDVLVNRCGDGAHALFHLGMREHQGRTIDNDPPVPATVVVMRADDNGNEAEVTRVTSRCEAERLVAEYEARAHKQIYWIVP